MNRIKINDDYLGVKYAAYGEYKCRRCGRKWFSSKAWRDFGQECQRCLISVNALKLIPLARYNCYTCERSWKTKFDEKGCNCDKCGKKIYPRKGKKRNPFLKPKILESESELDLVIIDPEKAHKQDLCEKCIFYRRSCIEVTEREMRIRPHAQKQTQIDNDPVEYRRPKITYLSSSSIYREDDQITYSYSQMLLKQRQTKILGTSCYNPEPVIEKYENCIHNYSNSSFKNSKTPYFSRVGNTDTRNSSIDPKPVITKNENSINNSSNSSFRYTSTPYQTHIGNKRESNKKKKSKCVIL